MRRRFRPRQARGRPVVLCALAAAGAVAVGLGSSLPAAAGPARTSSAPFFFSTGNPDGLMAMGSRQTDATGGQEIEAADDFILSATTTISSGTFFGLLTGGATIASIQKVAVEIYRAFPKDSANPPSGNVPTRTNSPSDVAFDERSSDSANLTFTTVLLSGNFNAANSVLNGINPIPSQTTGGEGPVGGNEVEFDLTFTTPFSLPADHYFFIPQVQLSTGEFLWLSAPKPIVAPGTPFVGDLQAWIRNANLDPDWLRVGTDIVGGQTTFNGTLSLTGASPTAVTIESFAAARTPAGVRLRWRTAVENGVLGFNLVRDRGGLRTRVNRVLIPSRSDGLTGHAYAYLDRKAPGRGPLRYWLQLVSRAGATRTFGPVRAP